MLDAACGMLNNAQCQMLKAEGIAHRALDISALQRLLHGPRAVPDAEFRQNVRCVVLEVTAIWTAYYKRRFSSRNANSALSIPQ